MLKISLVLILFSLNSLLCFGQNSPTDSGKNLPSPRNQPAATFDAARKRLVLFGGIDQAGKSLNDTWEWDAGNWRKVETAQSPPQRAAHAVVFDEKRKRVVLFGGQAGANSLADTWEFDGRNWTRIEAPNSPPARVAHALVYDKKLGKIILFGGTDFVSKQTFSDSWSFDGKTWTEIKTAAAPAGRFHHVLVYDSKRSRIVLFGGNTAVPPLSSEKFKAGQRSDTWEFDGRQWLQITSSDSPPSRDHHAAAYDVRTGKTIVFGGFSGGFEDGIYLGDTWAWDGKNWERLKAEPAPAARGGKPAMIFDSSRRRLVLFGGGTPQKAMNDLWFFADEKWSQ